MFSIQDSDRERKRLDTLKENGGDEYEIRAQDKVIADADQMLPDYCKRLATAIVDLEAIINSNDPGLVDTTHLVAAKAAASEARKQVQ